MILDSGILFGPPCITEIIIICVSFCTVCIYAPLTQGNKSQVTGCCIMLNGECPDTFPVKKCCRCEITFRNLIMGYEHGA